jgi:hypothetical protein
MRTKHSGNSVTHRGMPAYCSLFSHMIRLYRVFAWWAPSPGPRPKRTSWMCGVKITGPSSQGSLGGPGTLGSGRQRLCNASWFGSLIPAGDIIGYFESAGGLSALATTSNAHGVLTSRPESYACVNSTSLPFDSSAWHVTLITRSRDASFQRSFSSSSSRNRPGGSMFRMVLTISVAKSKSSRSLLKISRKV